MARFFRLCPATASLLALLLVISIPSSSLAATLTPEIRAELTASKLVSPALVEALEHQDRVVARVYFLVPVAAGATLSLRQPDARAQVSPVVLELAQAMLPGRLSLLHHDFLEALQGTVDARVVQSLLHNQQVVRIDLDETSVPEPEALNLGAKAACVPTSTRACVQGGRFSLEVLFSGGTHASVAASSSESAVFWFYTNTNWEVVAKVLNGCGVNNHFWILGAGATSTGYQLNVLDTVTGRSAGYNGAVLCPITDTGQAGFPGFPCP
jgi:hypothetical protein